MHPAFGFPHRAFDFWMTAVTNHDDLAIRSAHFGDFDMHFRYQRTGGIQHAQAARISLSAHIFGYAMGAKNHSIPGWNLLEFFNKHCALAFELIHHKFICLLYTSPSPRDGLLSRMPSSA